MGPAPYVLVPIYLATTLSFLGFIDQARSRINEALSEARRHALTLAETLLSASGIDMI